jgi:hypothetical protein
MEGGAIVAAGVAVWDIIDFQFLLWRYQELARSREPDKWKMVQAASTSSVRTMVEDLWSGYVDARLHHVFVQGSESKLGFGDENPEINLLLDSSPSAHVRNFLLEG